MTVAHFASQSSAWRAEFSALDNRPCSHLWYAARAAAAYDELVMVGKVKRADLEVQLKSAKSRVTFNAKLTASPSFFNFFSIDLVLGVNVDGKTSFSGLYPVISRLGGSALSYVAKCSSGTFKVLNCAHQPGVPLEATWSNSCTRHGFLAGTLSLSLVSQPFDISNWDSYFKDGKLSARGIISMCT